MYKFNEEGLVQHVYWDWNKEKWNVSIPMNVAVRGGYTVLMVGRDIKYLVMYISQQELQLGVFDQTDKPKMLYFLERKAEEPKDE